MSAAVGGHRSQSRGSSKPNCYLRLVGKRRQLAPPLPEEPGTSSSVFGWARDRVLGMVAGESSDERKTRLRLNWYKSVLQAEVVVVEKARLHFGQHGRDLAVEFEMQELQLQKWGLLNILPAFRMQAWARVSRSALLEDIAVVADKILRLRLQRSQDVIALYASDSRGSRKHPLGSYSAFCLEPDLVMAKEPALSQLGHRLARMDKVRSIRLTISRSMCVLVLFSLTHSLSSCLMFPYRSATRPCTCSRRCCPSSRAAPLRSASTCWATSLAATRP